MKVIDYLKIGREFLKKMSNLDLRRDDYLHIELYEEYIRMRYDGDKVDYHKSVLKEGEKMLETLNPRYAEEKKRDRSIKSLEERQDAQDKKLDKILAFMQELSTPKK